METVLNLIWLAITLAGVWLWWFRWFKSRGNQRGRIYPETVAVVCLIALLFPVISLTDDLHPEIMVAECASAKRNFCLLVAGPRISNAAAARQVHATAALVALRVAQIDFNATSLFLSPGILRMAFIDAIHLGRSPLYFLQA
jgi:hypothetical protein